MSTACALNLVEFTNRVQGGGLMKQKCELVSQKLGCSASQFSLSVLSSDYWHNRAPQNSTHALPCGHI